MVGDSVARIDHLSFNIHRWPSANPEPIVNSEAVRLHWCDVPEDKTGEDEDSDCGSDYSTRNPYRDSVASQSTCGSHTTNCSGSIKSSSISVLSSSTVPSGQGNGQNDQDGGVPPTQNGQDENNRRKRKHEGESSQDILALDYWPCPFYHHDKAKYVDSSSNHGYKSCPKVKVKELYRVKYNSEQPRNHRRG